MFLTVVGCLWNWAVWVLCQIPVLTCCSLCEAKGAHQLCKVFTVCSSLKKFVQSLLSSSFIMECFYFELKLLKTKKFFLVYISFPAAMFTCPGPPWLLRVVASVLVEEVGMNYHHPKSTSKRRLISIVGRFLPSRSYNVYEYGFFSSSVSPWGHYVSLACSQSLHVCMRCVLHTWVLALCLLVMFETVFL